MINLLPPQEKEILGQKIRANMVIVLLSCTVVTLACLAMVLLCVKFYILQEIAYQQQLAAVSATKNQDTQSVALKNSIQTYNASLLRMDHFYNNQISLSDALIHLASVARPGGVSFTSVNLQTSGSGGDVTVAISGVSDTRDNLVAFKNNLEQDSSIQQVNFPPDNWVKPSNIMFSATITMNSKAK